MAGPANDASRVKLFTCNLPAHAPTPGPHACPTRRGYTVKPADLAVAVAVFGHSLIRPTWPTGRLSQCRGHTLTDDASRWTRRIIYIGISILSRHLIGIISRYRIGILLASYRGCVSY
eukprot:3482055-Pyramimonas_sp.AAC.1